jgi:O-antigen/teichoic acid export membrane protein
MSRQRSARATVSVIARTLQRSRTIHQAAFFVSANGMVGVLAVVSTALLARGMSTSSYGTYAFAVSFLLFLALFCDFGLFLSVSRSVAKAEVADRRRLVGAGLVAYLPLALGYSIVVAALAPFVQTAFHVHVGEALLIVAPLAGVFPFVQFGHQLAQGTGRLHVSSVASVAAQALLVLMLVVAHFSLHRIGVQLALSVRVLAFVAAELVLVAWLRPAFDRVRQLIPRLWRDIRAYGFRVYVGGVLSLATYRMDVLMLGGFTNARTVGFYTLAGGLASAISLPALGLSGALFPRMARGTRLDLRWVIGTIAVSAAGVAALALLASTIVSTLYSSRYSATAGLIAPLAIAEGLRAVTTIFNSFLAAQGRGRELQNAGAVLTGSNLALNLGLIPAFGALGAAWASALALAANLGAHLVYYRRLRASVAEEVVAATV